MYPSAPPSVSSASSDWQLTTPAVNEAVPLHPDKTITVVVDDQGGHTDFLAAVYDVCAGTPPPPTACTVLTNPSGGSTFRGSVPVNFLDSFDIPEDHKLVVVYPRKDGVIGAPQIHRFRILHGGSAAGVSIASASGSQGRCGFCSGEDPIPVALRLTPNTAAGSEGIVAEDCDDCDVLNAVATLHHSGDACFTCSWFSDPIEFCGGEPGFWKLEKSDATTWDLRLLQTQENDQPNEIIHYTKTTPANDCTFPVTLNLDSASVGTDCSGWPDTITISQAP